jgi:membrane peptidoglycan carboxypeptidase
VSTSTFATDIRDPAVGAVVGDAGHDALASYSGSAAGKHALADEGRNLSTPSDPGMPTDGPTPEPVPQFTPEPSARFRGRTWRRFFSVKRVLLALLGLLLLGAGAVGVAFATVSIPQPNDLAQAQASIIYYSDGKTEMARMSTVNRESVPLSQIPLSVQHALLAAEDRTFYTNNGVSPTGIGRALIVALKGGPTQGGSTITQQYVKNYFLTQNQTLTRKAKEFIISIKIDQSEPKNTILANYLNTIYYGRGAYGIQTAAKAYFGVDASQLTVAQGALLASVIRGPSYYDPSLGASQKANAELRVKYVLDGMVSQGWLTPAARAKATFPKTIPRAKIKTAGTIGYITNEVRNELSSTLHLSASDIDRGGLRIVTTIDKTAQSAAVRAVNQNMPQEYSSPASADKALHVGLTAIRPGDGAIVAMYGGKDYSTDPYNSSTQATMQGGSTFKVFGLLAALQKGVSTKTRYDGYSPHYIPQFADPKNNARGKVTNFGDEQFGNIDLRYALANSVNTVFAQLNADLAAPGTSATGVRNAAIAAGLPPGCPGSTQGPTCTAGLGTDMTNILGTASPHVRDMANAFATIAAQGRRATPYLISRVTSTPSATLSIKYTVHKNIQTEFDPKVTADVTEAMTHVVTEGTGTAALALNRPAAGKTGTSTKNLAVWFDGFTPQLSAAVGIYQGDGKKTITVNNMGEVTGGTYPVKIWTAFMQGALQGQAVQNFPLRAGVGDSTLAPPPPPPTTAPAPTRTTPAPITTTTAPPAPTATSTPTFTRTQPGPTGPRHTFTQPPPTGPGGGGPPTATP